MNLGVFTSWFNFINKGIDFTDSKALKGETIKRILKIFPKKRHLELLQEKTQTLANEKSRKKAMKRSRKLVTRYGLVTANLLVVATVLLVLGQNRINEQRASQLPTLAKVDTSEQSGPVDAIAAADIAANVAIATQSPIAILVSNQADSERAVSKISAGDELAVTKPQIVATGGDAATSNDINIYTVVAGDTVSTIASKFNVTSRSIKDSNNLFGDFVSLGTVLRIPPRNRNGVVHKVSDGETPQSLASKYNANADKIVVFNDAELKGLTVGTYIFIPDGVRNDPAPNYSSASFAFFNPVYSGNNYAPGYCTWYAASRVSIPSNWGNANTWDSGARASGWVVSNTPVPGAIFQTDAGWAGHVGIVEEVSPDGTQIRFSDMNGIAGFGRVGFSGWVSSSRYVYIYR